LAAAGQDEFRTWQAALCPDGHVPQVGQLHRLPLHAASLRLLADQGAQEFYEGEVADRLDAFSRSLGGFLRKEDLATFKPQWVEPVSVNYRGYDVWELPPNGQGLVALMALNILNGFDFSAKGDVLTWHRAIEAIKLAFADGRAYITDPEHMTVSVSDLLSEAYADQRRALIGDRALLPHPGTPSGSGTVYIAAADSDGLMVSYIQSLYRGYGSGLFIPGTGIALQNRGVEFSLEPGHINRLAPHKRTYHTIIPGFMTKDGAPVGPFGVMGGYMQPQGHTQVIMNTLDFLMDPQQALDAPRFRWDGGLAVSLEEAAGADILQGLADRGHQISVTGMDSGYGHGQIIWRTDGGFVGGTEPRIDGAMAMY
jgi:gamma-glutamyltranspeptidase/glutathione hydrolase